MRNRGDPEIPSLGPPADPGALARLSARERQVLALAASGGLDKQIAASLGITLNTLRTYWTRIRSKLGDAPRSALAALYAADEASASALNPIDGASWHIDVARRVLVYYGERGIVPQGETPLDEILDLYHPEDQPGVRDLLRALETREMPPFAYAARLVTPDGLVTASDYVEAVHDEAGRTVRVVGRHLPLVNLAASGSKQVRVGDYRRDLATGRIAVDAGFRELFRLPAEVPDLEAAIVARLCPESRESVRRHLATMLAEGETSRLSTSRLCFEDGDRLWLSIRTRLEDGGRPAAIHATMLGYE